MHSKETLTEKPWKTHHAVVGIEAGLKEERTGGFELHKHLGVNLRDDITAEPGTTPLKGEVELVAVNKLGGEAEVASAVSFVEYFDETRVDQGRGHAQLSDTGAVDGRALRRADNHGPTHVVVTLGRVQRERALDVDLLGDTTDKKTTKGRKRLAPKEHHEKPSTGRTNDVQTQKILNRENMLNYQKLSKICFPRCLEQLEHVFMCYINHQQNTFSTCFGKPIQTTVEIDLRRVPFWHLTVCLARFNLHRL